MTSSPPTIRLRPINPARDAKALHAIFGDDAACRYLLEPAEATVAGTQAKLARWSSMAPKTDWAITEGACDDAVGRVTIYEKSGGVWEVGIVTCPTARGRGVTDPRPWRSDLTSR